MFCQKKRYPKLPRQESNQRQQELRWPKWARHHFSFFSLSRPWTPLDTVTLPPPFVEEVRGNTVIIMANKPPSFAALFRSPSCRRLLFVLCVVLVIYFIFKVASSGEAVEKEAIVSSADAYKSCIAKLGSVHGGTQKSRSFDF